MKKAYRGIDISQVNPIYDWAILRERIDFVLVRATMGMEDYDLSYLVHYEKAIEVGLDIGAYHYCQAKNVGEALVEAEHFYNFLKGKSFSYPCFLVFDDWKLYEPMNRKLRTDIVETFIGQMKKRKCLCGLYTPLEWIYSRFYYDRIKEFEFWVGERSEKPSFSGNLGIWQKESRGILEGINDRGGRPFGLNYSYKDYPDIIRKNRLNGY